MKILIVALWMYPDTEGGSVRFVYELGRSLVSKGNEVWVLTKKLSKNAPFEEDIDGMHIVRYVAPDHGIPFYVSTFLKVRRIVTQLVEIEHFDIINCHHLVPALGAYLARNAGATYIYNLHALYFLERMDRLECLRKGSSSYELISKGIKLLEGFLLKRSRLVIVHSQFTKGLVEKYFPSQLHKVVKVHGGVDISEFRYISDKSIARRKLELPLEGPILLTMRRLEHRMGLENLIMAMKEVVRYVPKALLLIGGRGNLRFALERLIKQLGLQESIKLLGFVPADRLPSYYQASDIFILPTRALEGFGMVTLEAMACGTPVLGTPVGGTTEILGDFDPSLLFDDTTPDAIAEKIISFLQGSQNLQLLGQSCRRYVEESYTWRKAATKYDRQLRKMLGVRGAMNNIQRTQ